MEPEAVRRALGAAPFVPFTNRMANDRVYHIDHPELAFVTSTGRSVVLEVEPGAIQVLALAASIEFQETATA